MKPSELVAQKKLLKGNCYGSVMIDGVERGLNLDELSLTEVKPKLEDLCGVCVMGSIAYCFHRNNWIQQAKFEGMIIDACRAKFNSSPVGWNDAPKRTKEEVIELLKEVEEKFIQEGGEIK